MKKSDKVILFCLMVLLILSFVRYIDKVDYWFVDIFSHFPVQYALSAFLFLIICLLKKTVPLLVLCGFVFILNISAVFDHGETIHAASEVRKTFKVYSANLHTTNNDLSKLKTELQETYPDIILLLEVTPVHFEQLQSVIKTYPYHKKVSSLGDLEIGFVLLSKFPIVNSKVTKLSKWCNFVIQAMIDINQEPVMFFGVHVQRPGLTNFDERKNQFLWLARQIKEQSLPVIAAGDFNATPYSRIFRELVKITGLKDSREGLGWQPSWPTYFPPLWIPIDHVLVTPDIEVRKRKTGSYIGSDHYPVIAELSL